MKELNKILNYFRILPSVCSLPTLDTIYDLRGTSVSTLLLKSALPSASEKASKSTETEVSVTNLTNECK